MNSQTDNPNKKIKQEQKQEQN